MHNAHTVPPLRAQTGSRADSPPGNHTDSQNSSTGPKMKDFSGILEKLWKRAQADKLGYRETLEHVERMLVQKYCGLFKKNLSAVARRMKVSRPTLYNLMEKFKIENPRKKAGK